MTEDKAIRNTKLLDLNINPYERRFDYFPAWLNKEIHFADGQIWTLTKMQLKKYRMKDTGEILEEVEMTFKNDKGRKTVYRSVFGGSRNKPQPAQKVVDRYFQQLKFEWLMNIPETPLLDALEAYRMRQG